MRNQVYTKLKFMLNNFQDRFNSFAKKTILEIFMVLTIVFLITVLYINSIESKKVKIQEHIGFTGNIYEVYSLIKQIENINIISSKIEKNSIKLQLVSNLNHIVFIINEIENINNFIKIKDYEIKKNDDKYKLSLEVNIDKFKEKKSKFVLDYEVKKNTKVKLVNKIKQEVEIKEVNEEIKFKLSAIVFDSVILNNKYLKKDEMINGYKLIQIRNKSIILSKNNKNIEVRLYD